MILTIEIVGENGGSRIEYVLSDVKRLRIRASSDAGDDWQLSLGGEAAELHISDDARHLMPAQEARWRAEP